MPKTLYDENNNAVEVPTDEELQTQIEEKTKEAVEKSGADFENQMREKYEIPEGTTVDDYVKELQDSGDPNWKEARRIMKNQETVIEQLKKEGKTLDDQGNIIDKPESFSKEDVANQSREVVQDEMYKAEKTKLLSNLSEDEKKVVEVTLDKLISGEEKSMDNLYKYAEQALNLEYPDKGSNPLNQAINTSGQPPRPKSDKQDYSESDAGMDAAKKMNLGFAQEKPKPKEGDK